MVAFLVETDSPNGEEVLQNFIYAAQEMEHKVILTNDGNIENLIGSPDEPLVFFGSLNMIKKLQAKNLPHKPLAWCDWDKLSCHSYYPQYGKFLIHEEYGFYPFGELPRLQEYLYKTYGHKNKIFVRPDSNDKIFTGEVVGEPQFDIWYNMAGFYEPKPSTLCVVSKPTKIKSEFRFIVANGKVISGSRYKIAGMFQSEGKYDQNLVDFAEEIASVWQPHPIFVMDVAITDDNQLRLIEIGQVNGAGFYKCEIRPIVKAMAEIAESQLFEAWINVRDHGNS